MTCFEAVRWQRRVAVDVDAEVLAGQDDRPFAHEGDVEAVRMLHLALESSNELAGFGEDGHVEIVVIVGDDNLAETVNANTDRVVGDVLSADATQKHPLVVEDLRG